MDVWIYGYIAKVGVSTYQPINKYTQNHQAVCRYMCGYGCGCVNANVVDSVSANGNVAGYVDVYKKFLASIDKAKRLCYNSLTK